jgi:acyl-coenzyme A thioesterase PaaI-like protein
MADSVFIADGDAFTPTEHARGPWDPHALHGGAPAALIAAAFESFEPGSELRVARLGFEFLRPVPLAPLRLSTRVIRPGRRVQELAAELTVASDVPPGRRGGAASDRGADDGELICRASALRVREVPADVSSFIAGARRDQDAQPVQSPLGDPGSGRSVPFALNDSSDASFGATAMEMRWRSDPRELGPGQVWMRLRQPLLPGQPPTPLARLVAIADFGNGVSAELPFDRFLFINADLTIHLQRAPRGEWIGLDARTLLHAEGMGLAESVLYDAHGAVGRAFQTLVVQAR